MIAVAFAMIPASAISYLVLEKELSLRHMQLISGMSLSSYWLTTFSFDLIRGLIVSAFTFGLIKAFNITNLINDDVKLLLFLYPLAIIPCTYATSWMFSKAAIAVNVSLFIHIAFSTIVAIVAFFLRLY